MTDKERQAIEDIKNNKWWILNRQERFEYNKTPVESGQNSDEMVFLSLSHNKKIDDRWLEKIGQITSLESLHIDLTSISDKGLHYLGNLNNLKDFNLRGTKITDRSIKAIASLRSIEYLWLNDTEVKGETLHYLENLKCLTNLFLGGTGINDEFLKVIKEFKRLEYLQLFDTDITVKSFDVFRSLSSLKSLDITRTKISEKSAKDLQQLLPNVFIHFEDW